MHLELSFDFTDEENEPRIRRRTEKGHSLLSFPNDYIVIDIETTGLNTEWDEIIEISAIKISNNSQLDKFSTLIKPREPIPKFIVELTGITNQMVESAPSIKEALPGFLKFIGDAVLVGHNVNFDINFIYDACCDNLNIPLTNDFVDTMRISRRLLPDLEHHRLKDITAELEVEYTNAHRALNDCIFTYQCFEKLRDIADDKPEMLISKKSKKNYNRFHNVRASDIVASTNEFDEDNPFYGKTVVVTGVLQKMSRAEVMQLIADIGGINGDNVTKKTDYLVLGNNDYCKSIRDGKSSKQKKAEKYILDGLDIKIISENTFYDMIDES